jgi:SpoVK/Ycf46/Vps4 family AAA+-type ATPase
MFRQYLLSKETLLLLSGETGTGKTKVIDLFLQYATSVAETFFIKEEDDIPYISAVYVKNTEILSMDRFWMDIAREKYDVIILDDVDHMLISREHNTDSFNDNIRGKFISNFLSFSDGITNTKTKFIITTNQATNNMDTAILRKGRCFDVLKFRNLKKKEAQEIWKEAKLPFELFKKEFDDVDIIKACDLGSKIELYRNLKKQNSGDIKSYVLEDNISLYKNSSDTIKKVIIG